MRASPSPIDGVHRPGSIDDDDAVQARRAVAAQGLTLNDVVVGWFEAGTLTKPSAPARMLRPVVLIEGSRLSCKRTTLYTPVAWFHVAHSPLPITSAGGRSSDTPTATLPTLPTHRPPIRHAVSYRYDNRSGLETCCRAVETSTHTRERCAVACVADATRPVRSARSPRAARAGWSCSSLHSTSGC
jgi:hypothetical protein